MTSTPSTSAPAASLLRQLHTDRHLFQEPDFTGRAIIATVRHNIALDEKKIVRGRIKAFKLLIAVRCDEAVVTETSFLIGYRCSKKIQDSIRDSKLGESHQFQSFWNMTCPDSGIRCTLTLNNGTVGHRRTFRDGCAMLKGASEPSPDDMIATIGLHSPTPYSFLLQASLPADSALLTRGRYSVEISLALNDRDKDSLSLDKDRSSNIPVLFRALDKVKRLKGTSKPKRTPPPVAAVPTSHKKAKCSAEATPSASKLDFLAEAAMTTMTARLEQEAGDPLLALHESSEELSGFEALFKALEQQ